MDGKKGIMKNYDNISPNGADICSIKTFSPADMLLLPSASRAERDPMPIDGKTANCKLLVH